MAAIDPAPAQLAFLPARLRYWLVASGRYASVQGLVQIVGFGTGILIIRKMSQKEYAFYTIASSMQGTMNLLADMGIGSAVLALGGRVWQDRLRLGEVIKTALRLRYTLATCSALVVAPVVISLLLRQGATAAYAVLLLVIIVASLCIQLSNGILIVVLRLHAELGRLQTVDFLSSVARFALIAAVCFFFLNSSIALIAACLAGILQLVLLRRWSADNVDFDARPNPENRAEMLRVVRSQAPIAIFYCFQGQISVWLISIFGQVAGVAELGALSRIAVLFSVLGSVVTGMMVPRFARCQDPRLLSRQYTQILAACALFGLAVLAGAALFTPQFLWLLGKRYAHLAVEFHLMVISTIVASMATAIYVLNMARAWVKHSWLYIPLTLLTQAGLLAVLDISTVRGVLLFGIFSQIPSLFVNTFLSWRGFRETRRAFGAQAPAAFGP